MATVHVNGKPVDIGGERLNCVQAAERAGVLVPHYCYHEALSVVASCRMCLVEVGDMKDGKPVMLPRVVPGCQTPVKDGTVIVTDSPKAKAAQGQTLEGLLINHPLDCPVCDKAGECKLQDYSFQFGHAKSRMIDDKNQPPNKPELSDKITLFTDRCIMCTRCVRFTREISGTAELHVINRGHHSEIDVFPGEPLENKLAGNVVDLCPVGALGSKDFLYKQRVWYLKNEKSVCPDCSTGCSIEVDANKDVVFRLRPRENPQAQGHFMCDEGRWGYHYINDKDRLARPQVREGGTLKAAPWARLLPGIRADFTEAAKNGTVWGVFSPFLTVEEAYLLAKYLKGLAGTVNLALGPVPVSGEDDSYPKDRRGNGPPADHVKFTIRSEKCPNRRGVEAVLRQFQGEIVPFAQLSDATGVFLTGGCTRKGWLPEGDAANLAKSPLLLTMDFFPGPATASAKYVLPATAFAEKEGTFVNHAGLAQALHRAARAPHECRGEGQVFSDLLERKGLWRAADTRRELAAEIPALAALAGELGEHGIRM